MANKILGVLGVGAEERIRKATDERFVQAFPVDEKKETSIAVTGTFEKKTRTEVNCVSIWLDGEPQMSTNGGLAQEAWANWPEGIGKLHGSFALAAWNNDKKELILVRDCLGTCPLYYAPVSEGIAFGSNLADVVSMAELDKALNLEAVSDYLTYLYIPFPKTIIKGTFKVPPGCFLLWRNGEISIEPYFDFDLKIRQISESQAIDELEQKIDRAVEGMWEDDCGGVFLSGGIDSTTVLSFAYRHAKNPVSTFSLGFKDAPLYDERERVSFITDYFKTKHNQFEVGPDSIAILPELVKHYDEPFGNATSLLIYELARKARKEVSVVLTGDGGDEFFAGYPRLAGIEVSRKYRRLPEFFRKFAIDPVLLSLPESLDGRHWLRRAREFVKGSQLPLDEMYVSWITYFDEKSKRKLLHPDILAKLDGYDARNCILDVMSRYLGDVELGAHYADLAFFLPCNGIEYVSKSTRAHDLTVRSPLLDSQVTSLAASLPMALKLNRRRPKYLLRQLAKRILPLQVLKWPKIGFNSPVGIWLKKEPGKGMVLEYLAPESVERRGIFVPTSIAALVSEFFHGKRDISLEIWALMFLEAWCREHLDC